MRVRGADFGVFAGVLGETGGWVWFFDGQVVVKCVVNVDSGCTLFADEEYATDSNYFLRVVREWKGLRISQPFCLRVRLEGQAARWLLWASRTLAAMLAARTGRPKRAPAVMAVDMASLA